MMRKRRTDLDEAIGTMSRTLSTMEDEIDEINGIVTEVLGLLGDKDTVWSDEEKKALEKLAGKLRLDITWP